MSTWKYERDKRLKAVAWALALPVVVFLLVALSLGDWSRNHLLTPPGLFLTAIATFHLIRACAFLYLKAHDHITISSRRKNQLLFVRDRVKRRMNFGLFLRSSTCDHNIRRHNVLPSLQERSPGLYGELEVRLRPLTLVAVNNPGTTGQIPSIRYDDEVWKVEIAKDFEYADFMLLLPIWMSESVKWEVNLIRSMGLVRKLAIVMPPHATLEASPGWRREMWEGARNDLRALGIEIPGYRDDGAVLLCVEDEVFDVGMCFSDLQLHRLRHHLKKLALSQ